MYDIQAIDIVCNIFTEEVEQYRPKNRKAFYQGKMKVDDDTMRGVSLTEMLVRMDSAGIEVAFLIASKNGPLGHPSCYHLPYELVERAVKEHPDRFCGLAGVDPTEGMQGVRELERAVKDMGFVARPLLSSLVRNSTESRALLPLLCQVRRTRHSNPAAGRAVDDLCTRFSPAERGAPNHA